MKAVIAALAICAICHSRAEASNAQGREILQPLLANCQPGNAQLPCDGPIFQKVWLKIPSADYAIRLDVKDVNILQDTGRQFLEIYLYFAPLGDAFQFSDVHDLLLNCKKRFQDMGERGPITLILAGSMMQDVEARVCRGRTLRN